MATYKPATLAAQALGWVEPTTRALVPPIHPSTAYVRAPDGSYPGGHTYTRDQNPTYDQAEAVLAELEGGEQALLFSSGMAAATTVFETLRPGAHVVAPRRMYWTIRGWLAAMAERERISLSFYENTDTDSLRAALRPGETELCWIETPSNPLCDVTDIAAAAELAHDAGAIVAADSTVATPVLCRPLALGVDIVMHSATKQIAGHGDVLAGVLTTRTVNARWERIRHERGYRGAVLGPFETWLLLRGLRTMYLRVERSASSALRIATALADQPVVERVFYAGLPDHPGHEVATRQMTGGFGSVVSFTPRGGEAATRKVLGALKLFHDATSLGSVESLVEHRAKIEGDRTEVPDDLLRLSIGIEDPDDLIDDLRQALQFA